MQSVINTRNSTAFFKWQTISSRARIIPITAALIDNLRNENAILNAKVDSHACNVSIPNLRDDNVDLLAKIDELNVSLASLRLENENLIAKAKDFDVCKVTISSMCLSGGSTFDCIFRASCKQCRRCHESDN